MTIVLMFLPYVSTAFVPADTMPSWLRGLRRAPAVHAGHRDHARPVDGHTPRPPAGVGGRVVRRHPRRRDGRRWAPVHAAYGSLTRFCPALAGSLGRSGLGRAQVAHDQVDVHGRTDARPGACGAHHLGGDVDDVAGGVHARDRSSGPSRRPRPGRRCPIGCSTCLRAERSEHLAARHHPWSHDHGLRRRTTRSSASRTPQIASSSTSTAETVPSTRAMPALSSCHRASSSRSNPLTRKVTSSLSWRNSSAWCTDIGLEARTPMARSRTSQPWQ